MATLEQLLSEILRSQRESLVKLGEIGADVRQVKERQLEHEKRDEERFSKLEQRDAELEDDVEEITGQHKAIERAEDVLEKRRDKARTQAAERRSVWLPIVLAIVGSAAGAVAIAVLTHIAWR